MKGHACARAAVAAALLLSWETGTRAQEPVSAALAMLEMHVAELEAAVASLMDHAAILGNERNYDRGLDRHDEALMSSAFWPDAELIYGSVDVERLPSWANEIHSASAAHKHHTTSLWLDVDGDVAHAEVDIVFSSNVPRDRTADAAGAPTPGRVVVGAKASLGSGRYINRYERRDGEWRIRVHDYIQDVTVMLDMVDVCATACLGRWDVSDISYMRPLEPLSANERRMRAEQARNPRAQVAPPSDDR